MNRPAVACAALLLLGLFAAWRAAHGHAPRRLTLATWNLQWLLAPDTARAARIACRDTGRAPLPCDVALGNARDSADLGRLAAHARRLDADVIAFQEVEDAGIAQQVFKGYDICMAGGPGVQHAGFAVRRGLAHHCGPEVQALTAGGRGRAGMSLTLLPAGMPAIDVLAVHLKSGCARDPLDSGSAACRLLAAQADALGRWITWRAGSGIAFVVLGDFNRAGRRTADDPFWSRLDPATFIAAADQLPFGNCVFGAPYSEFIDHVLVSRNLLPRLARDAFHQLPFRTRDAARYRLSDHCPVGVSLNLAEVL